MAKNSSIGSSLYFEYFSGMAYISQSASGSLRYLFSRPLTHPEKLDVVEDMVVVGEVIAWNDIDASVLLYFPVFLPETLAFCEKVFL